MRIALNSQIHLYSFDTSAFYTDAEHELDQRCTLLRVEKIKNKAERDLIQTALKNSDEYSAVRKKILALRKDEPIDISTERISELRERNKEITKELSDNKQKLKDLFKEHRGIRTVRQESIRQSSIISIFESFLTRTLGLKHDDFTDAIIIVRVFFFEVFRDLVHDGFMMNGKKYVFLSASAGQIRTKKAVMVREDLWLKHQNTIMCGLTVDRINELGGCNTNKYLAYLALCNSATDVWGEFDIDKSIVVDDMETLVSGVVDHIDSETYEIVRKEAEVPIVHTDGCGMVLPHLTDGKNTMVRLPWVKGLLGVFQFDEFIRQVSDATGWNCGLVKDIYGKEHDVLAEGIEVIFTKSQFKMSKYYESWDEYKEKFKKYGCTACICNMEDDVIGNASINYQMLQTLTDLTDDELKSIAATTNYKLKHLATDKKMMLRALGASEGNPDMTPLQKCLMLYPELLQDFYIKEDLRNLKASLQKQAWAGKLDIYAKYLFVLPDLFAFCEWLFCGNKNPQGLLDNGEVYAELFPKSEKLDCLRSPHLYREHPVRKNVYCDDAKSVCKVWYSKRAIYTSCHDLISKVLQFDNDGDKLLCVADKTIISAAERNMQDIVPLDYDLRKAGASPITLDSVYKGMTAAYTGGNIGPISNTISKIWNAETPDIESVARLCLINNETIDYAKTLYKSTPPKEVSDKLQSYSKQKVPHFFVYAKNKEKWQVQKRNNSPVNRLVEIIPKQRFNFKPIGSDKFDYRMLMHNPKLIYTPGADMIVREYLHFIRHIRVNPKSMYSGEDGYSYQFRILREHILSLNNNPYFVVDSIIYGIFAKMKSARKRLFWGAFGEIVLENLKANLDLQLDDSMLCHKCLNRFSIKTYKLRCPVCGFQHSGTKIVTCIDCGEEFLVDARNNSKIRCDKCQEIFRKQYKTKMQRKYRSIVDT